VARKMARIWALTRKEVRQILRDPSSIAIALSSADDDSVFGMAFRSMSQGFRRRRRR